MMTCLRTSLFQASWFRALNPLLMQEQYFNNWCFIHTTLAGTPLFKETYSIDAAPPRKQASALSFQYFNLFPQRHVYIIMKCNVIGRNYLEHTNIQQHPTLLQPSQLISLYMVHISQPPQLNFIVLQHVAIIMLSLTDCFTLS